MVRSDIHEKTLKSRYAHAKTDTDRQGASEKDKRCMYGSEHGKRDRQRDQGYDGHDMDLAMVHQPSGNQTGRPYTDRHTYKEIAWVRHLDLFTI